MLLPGMSNEHAPVEKGIVSALMESQALLLTLSGDASLELLALMGGSVL